jgi:hypothetical protein
MSELYSAAPTQWTERLGLAVMAIVVGAYFVMLMTDVAWDVGLLP